MANEKRTENRAGNPEQIAGQTPERSDRKPAAQSAAQSAAKSDRHSGPKPAQQAAAATERSERKSAAQSDAKPAPQAAAATERSERKSAAQSAAQSAAKSDRHSGPKPAQQAAAATERSERKSAAQSAAKPAPQAAASDPSPKRRPPRRSGRSIRSESDGQSSDKRLKSAGNSSSGSGRSSAGNGRKQDARRESASVGRTGGRWTWRDYVLQFSVVFLGVLVTFIGSGIVERWRTQRAARTVMQLVYEELKTNRDNIERTCRDLEHERRGIVLMQEYGLDYTRVPVDSLDKYRFILSQMPDFTPQSDALEMLRSSGTMIAVDDKQLFFEVLGCYTWVNSFAASVESYNNQKMNALNHLFEGGTDFCRGGSDPVASWKSMMADPMCSAFVGVMGSFFGREQLNGGAVAAVDAVTAALNEKYRFERQDARN